MRAPAGTEIKDQTLTLKAGALIQAQQKPALLGTGTDHRSLLGMTVCDSRGRYCYFSQSLHKTPARGTSKMAGFILAPGLRIQSWRERQGGESLRQRSHCTPAGSREMNVGAGFPFSSLVSLGPLPMRGASCGKGRSPHINFGQTLPHGHA